MHHNSGLVSEEDMIAAQRLNMPAVPRVVEASSAEQQRQPSRGQINQSAQMLQLDDLLQL